MLPFSLPADVGGLVYTALQALLANPVSIHIDLHSQSDIVVISDAIYFFFYIFLPLLCQLVVPSAHMFTVLLFG